jgi:hypothetical protein
MLAPSARCWRCSLATSMDWTSFRISSHPAGRPTRAPASSHPLVQRLHRASSRRSVAARSARLTMEQDIGSPAVVTTRTGMSERETSPPARPTTNVTLAAAASAQTGRPHHGAPRDGTNGFHTDPFRHIPRQRSGERPASRSARGTPRIRRGAPRNGAGRRRRRPHKKIVETLLTFITHGWHHPQPLKLRFPRRPSQRGLP